jgi:hypothetical protein
MPDDPAGEFLELALAVALLYAACVELVGRAAMRDNLAVVRAEAFMGVVEAMKQVEDMGLAPS